MIKSALACLFAALACFAIAGCAAGGTPEDGTAAFAGTWEIVEISGDNALSAEDFEMMKLASSEMTVTLQLDEDGTGVLNLFGEKMSGTWSASNATQATLVFDEQEIEMSLADETLTLTQAGQNMLFKRAEAVAAAASSATVPAASSAPAASSTPAPTEDAEPAQAQDQAAQKGGEQQVEGQDAAADAGETVDETADEAVGEEEPANEDEAAGEQEAA